MANRSDFMRATLPRRIKKLLALQPFNDAHEYGAVKRLWVDAHAHAKNCKQRMNSSPTGRMPDDDTSAST